MTKWECGLEMIILGSLRNRQLTLKIWTYVLNRYRYECATEYMQVMKDLWTQGRSNFNGSISPWKIADYCHCLPLTSSLLLRARYVKRQLTNFAFSTKCFLDKRSLLIPCPGRAFAAKYCDYNFTSGAGLNQPTAFKQANSRLVETSKIEGRNVGALLLFTIIADEMDDAAHAKFEQYNHWTDVETLAWMKNQSGKTKRLTNSPLLREWLTRSQSVMPT